jgi:hypothetical protein
MEMMNELLSKTIAYIEANYDDLMELFDDLKEIADGEVELDVVYISTLFKLVELAARAGYSSDEVVRHTRQYYEARTAVAYARGAGSAEQYGKDQTTG